MRSQLSCLLALIAVPFLVNADNGGKRGDENVRAQLSGYQEVPAVSTVAKGTFRARIDSDERTIEYELTYSGLQGTVSQAHIHFAQPAVNGSIVVWLCGTAANPGPAGTPVCPAEGTVDGVITASQVVAASTAAQQIAAGEIDEVIDAIRAGRAYVNVHTSISPGGEIRGQIQHGLGGR